MSITVLIIIITSLIIIAGTSVGVYFYIKNKKLRKNIDSGDSGECKCINTCPSSCDYSGGLIKGIPSKGCGKNFKCPLIQCPSTSPCPIPVTPSPCICNNVECPTECGFPGGKFASPSTGLCPSPCPEITCPSTSPCKKYITMSPGTLCPGTQIKNIDTCTRATGITSSLTNESSFPSGCYLSEKKSYFNTSPTPGKPNNLAQPVCNNSPATCYCEAASSCPKTCGLVNPTVPGKNNCTGYPGCSPVPCPSTKNCCPKGEYRPSSFSEICDKCDAGTYKPNPGDNKSDCKQCLPGSFSTAGSANCTECLPGTYSASPGEVSCTVCPSGQGNISSGSTKCNDCLPGQYSNLITKGICKPCDAGTYSSSPGEASCIPCNPGYFASSPGERSCSICPQGYYSTSPGEISCTSCAPGYSTASPGSTSPSSCVECPSNYYSNQETNFVCTACPSDYYSQEGSPSCTLNKTVPNPCTPGKDCNQNIVGKVGSPTDGDINKIDFGLTGKQLFSSLANSDGKDPVTGKECIKDGKITGNCLNLPCKLNPNYMTAQYCKNAGFSHNLNPGGQPPESSLLTGLPPFPNMPVTSSIQVNQTPASCYLFNTPFFEFNAFDYKGGSITPKNPISDISGCETIDYNNYVDFYQNPSKPEYKKCLDALYQASKAGETCTYWDRDMCEKIKNNPVYKNLAKQHPHELDLDKVQCDLYSDSLITSN